MRQISCVVKSILILQPHNRPLTLLLYFSSRIWRCSKAGQWCQRDSNRAHRLIKAGLGIIKCLPPSPGHMMNFRCLQPVQSYDPLSSVLQSCDRYLQSSQLASGEAGREGCKRRKSTSFTSILWRKH